MSEFRKLESAAVNADRVLSVQVARHCNAEAHGVAVTYDTGHVEVIECEKPAEAIADYLALLPLSEGSGAM
jgi:hypothetical protein